MAAEVSIPVGKDVCVQGELSVPGGASGVVLFAHGSGSSRFSPRNRYVARRLEGALLATLLVDLLTPEEEEAERWTRHLRLDIELLAQRLGEVTRWLAEDARTSGLTVGYFGASTGAGAALVAAAREPDRVAAVVSRGGRPDLAGAQLMNVHAPVLLIVGGNDTPVIEMNRRALHMLHVERQLVIVPGAGHLFEEPGALERVAELATVWFMQKLGAYADFPAPR